MGSRRIDQPTPPKNSLMLLQQHTFVHDWCWELTIVGNLQELMDDIQAGNSFSVSDSSFQVGRGTAAWIIEGKTNENQLLEKCLSSGNDNGHSSFQSKLAGIYTILFTLYMLLPTTTAIMPFRLACNGKSVLMQLQQY